MMSHQSKITEALPRDRSRNPSVRVYELSPAGAVHTGSPGRRAGYGLLAFFVLAASGCNGIVEAPPRATLVATFSPATADSSGIQASAPTVELPSDYQSWPVFLSDVQRTDNGQVRDLYVNEVGSTVQEGQPFPNGTLLVMDLFAAQKDAAGAPVHDSNGAMLKGALMKTFVMGKDSGWGNYVSSDLRNGDWLYSAYGPDGKTPTADPMPPCFSCHLPLGASQDWVQRYRDYFVQRGARNP
jgi:hypothetical protein